MTDPVVWNLPIGASHHLSASAGALSFVGGAGDFNAEGRIKNPDDFERQVEGAIVNLAEALDTESCSLDDVVRLKVHYTSEHDDWEVLAALARCFKTDPIPVISTVPEPLQPFTGQKVQIQAIAQRGWRGLPDIRSVAWPVPPAKKDLFAGRTITAGLRAGEFIAIANCAAEDASGEICFPSDGVAQTHFIMERHARTLASLGASFQDSVKMEAHHLGSTREVWAPMAKARMDHFREPGPVASVLPCFSLHPTGAQAKIEVLAMRELWNGYDKYIPREDHWPKRVWDWPIPTVYRQAIGLRGTIWLGGQVPFHPYSNKGERVLRGQLLPQTRFTMGYIEDLLRGFGRSLADLKLLVCYFSSSGTEAESVAFLKTIAECVGGAVPPVTLLPSNVMRDKNTVEIWGVAQR